MTDDFLERLKKHFDQLSPGQSTVAEFLAREPRLLAFGTASDIGRASGVSETTVIRLAHTLGYRGFAEMQEHAQGTLAPQLMPDFVSRAASEFPEGTGMLGRVLEHDMNLLRRTLDTNRPEVFDQAVAILGKAERIFVTGARSSYGVAHFLWYTLRMQVGDATFLEANTPPFISDLAEMNERTALVVVAYPRYSQATLNIAAYARRQGCPMVAITDNPLSPIGRMAEAALITPTESVAATMSFAPAISLAVALITGVAVQRRRHVDQRLSHLEQVHDDWKRISQGN